MDWIKQKKEQANQFHKERKHDEAVDSYMQALCGFNFKQSKYGKLTAAQKTTIEMDLKLPILNNMAFSFY